VAGVTPPSSPPNAEPFDDLDEALLLARAREKLLSSIARSP
jgi:hypothetical protein